VAARAAGALVHLGAQHEGVDDLDLVAVAEGAHVEEAPEGEGDEHRHDPQGNGGPALGGGPLDPGVGADRDFGDGNFGGGGRDHGGLGGRRRGGAPFSRRRGGWPTFPSTEAERGPPLA
jgi:hypothetical protein